MNGVDALELVLGELKKDEQNYDVWPEDVEEAAYIVSLWAKRLVGSAGDIKHREAPIFMLKKSAAKVGALAIRLLINLEEESKKESRQEAAPTKKEEAHE